MRVADPLAASWNARLGLRFEARAGTVLAERRQEGPLVVQKPLYPEGREVCHAIVVHPPGGIAGGDQLVLDVTTGKDAHALLTTPGAGKWYRSSGSQAEQELRFDVAGTLEWLPRETIVFDGALARLTTAVELQGDARYIGWEVLCLGRTGSGERFSRGAVELETTVRRDGRPLWIERGRIDGGGRLMSSPAGLGGHTVCGTLAATIDSFDRKAAPACLAVTLLPGLLLARYLGDSSEEALQAFAQLWAALRPAVTGRAAVEPRIWRT